MLCPMGEVLEGARAQQHYGARHWVLWTHRHRRKREATDTNPHSGDYLVVRL